jgi:hypothetical protein
MRKHVALLIAMLAVSSLILVKTSCAQIGVTNPAIPSFGVTLQTHSNYIPPTYGVDSSTGKAVMIKEGYTEVEKWVRVEIGGQPFLRYNNSDGQLISLFYNVRWKENHDTSWQYIPQDIHYEDAAEPWASQAIGRLISIGFKGIKDPASGWMKLLDPNATQIDFQVEALIGYYTADNVFVGQASGWSNTQTISIPEGQTPTPSPPTTPATTPTPTLQQEPQQTEQEIIGGAAIAVAVIAVGLGLLVYLIKRK